MSDLSVFQGASKSKIEDILAVAKTVSYLPRLQVCGSSTDIVKEGKLPVGVWGMIYDKNTQEDLGKEIDVILVAFRTKALDMADKAKGNIFSYYDHNSEAFKAIARRSEVQNSNCMFGPEFLVWIPTAGESGKFATFFMGSPSARQETPKFLEQMSDGGSPPNFGPAPATLKTFLVKGKKGSWHVGQAYPCSTPIEILPQLEESQKVLEAFNNPTASVVEKLEPAGGAPARER